MQGANATGDIRYRSSATHLNIEAPIDAHRFLSPEVGLASDLARLRGLSTFHGSPGFRIVPPTGLNNTSSGH